MSGDSSCHVVRRGPNISQSELSNATSGWRVKLSETLNDVTTTARQMHRPPTGRQPLPPAAALNVAEHASHSPGRKTSSPATHRPVDNRPTADSGLRRYLAALRPPNGLSVHLLVRWMLTSSPSKLCVGRLATLSNISLTKTLRTRNRQQTMTLLWPPLNRTVR